MSISLSFQLNSFFHLPFFLLSIFSGRKATETQNRERARRNTKNKTSMESLLIKHNFENISINKSETAPRYFGGGGVARQMSSSFFLDLIIGVVGLNLYDQDPSFTNTSFSSSFFFYFIYFKIPHDFCYLPFPHALFGKS